MYPSIIRIVQHIDLIKFHFSVVSYVKTYCNMEKMYFQTHQYYCSYTTLRKHATVEYTNTHTRTSNYITRMIPIAYSYKSR